jgi:hypothetical protein
MYAIPANVYGLEVPKFTYVTPGPLEVYAYAYVDVNMHINVHTWCVYIIIYIYKYMCTG